MHLGTTQLIESGEINMAMNEWLSEMYGTNKVASAEPAEETAQLELFAKLAADNGIDLSQLTGDQVNALYAETFGKTAEEAAHEEHESKKEEAVEEKAKKEHEEKKESAAKLAEADLMGRTMAHAFVSEVNEIEKTARYGEEHAAKAWHAVHGAAESAGKSVMKGLHHAGDVLSGRNIENAKSRAGAASLHEARAKALHEAAAKAKGPRVISERLGEISKTGPATRASKEHGQRLEAAAGRSEALAGRSKGRENIERLKTYGARGGLAAAGIGTGIAGGAALGHKESSALDELAAIEAVKTAAAAGWDSEEAAYLVSQALDAAGESTKIAYVENTGDAIYVRGLEMLETAGYPVDWTQIFG